MTKMQLTRQVMNVCEFYDDDNDRALKKNRDEWSAKADNKTLKLFNEWLIKNQCQNKVFLDNKVKFDNDQNAQYCLIEQSDVWVVIQNQNGLPTSSSCFTSIYQAVRYLKGLLA